MARSRIRCSEITVAGNLMEMFLNLRAANDLEFRSSTNAPILRSRGNDPCRTLSFVKAALLRGQ